MRKHLKYLAIFFVASFILLYLFPTMFMSGFDGLGLVMLFAVVVIPLSAIALVVTAAYHLIRRAAWPKPVSPQEVAKKPLTAARLASNVVVDVIVVIIAVVGLTYLMFTLRDMGYFYF